MRTREGMAVAKARGRLRGKKPNLSLSQRSTYWTWPAPAFTPKLSWPSCSAYPEQPLPRAPASWKRSRH